MNHKLKTGFFAFLVCAITCSANINAQIVKSVEAFSNYSTALSRSANGGSFIAPDILVKDANGLGGGVKLNINVWHNYYVGLSFGYELYSVHQDSAIVRWNWLFWDTRYKGFIQDALNSNPNLSGLISPIQKLEIMPVFVTFNAEYNPLNHFFVNPSVGFGVVPYTRKLYLEETWQKKFTDLNYTFGYSFRNFAPNKTGNPFALTAGLNLAYELSDEFRIHTEADYVQFIKTPGKAGSDDFPIERLINIKLGLTILY